jgi:hypothetical protein
MRRVGLAPRWVGQELQPAGRELRRVESMLAVVCTEAPAGLRQKMIATKAASPEIFA